MVLTGDEQDYAIKTWRYLRLAMVLLVAGLGVSIAYERLKVDPGCLQTSISSYYYTPVHGFLIGALVSMGVCLICLRGNTDLEDVFLNLAGMLAPVVAFGRRRTGATARAPSSRRPSAFWTSRTTSLLCSPSG